MEAVREKMRNWPNVESVTAGEPIKPLSPMTPEDQKLLKEYKDEMDEYIKEICNTMGIPSRIFIGFGPTEVVGYINYPNRTTEGDLPIIVEDKSKNETQR